MKTCSQCKLELPKTNFNKRSKSTDGLMYQCRNCQKEYCLLNKELIKAKKKETYEENKEEILLKKAEYYISNCEVIKQKRRDAYEKTPDVYNAYQNIELIYNECRGLTESTGIEHHVDHSIPLTSKLVWGLHCESNLQILTAQANLSKSNSYWPDMW